jgi:metal-dependent amidase/aminoacylase/carboxypeptidase family protein
MTANLEDLVRQMTAWRRDLHAHPEFGFEEKRTSAFVAAKLREFGLDEVAEGVGGTGVVGTLKRGSGNRAVALRADMDALRIAEQGAQPYRAQFPGYDACMWARRPYRNAARGRKASCRGRRIRRDGPLHLPTRRGVGQRCARHAC